MATYRRLALQCLRWNVQQVCRIFGNNKSRLFHASLLFHIRFFCSNTIFSEGLEALHG